MSNSANQLGGRCPYMPYLGRGQMSGGGGGGGHVLHSLSHFAKSFVLLSHLKC